MDGVVSVGVGGCCGRLSYYGALWSGSGLFWSVSVIRWFGQGVATPVSLVVGWLRGA
jgi:hypothetical protein